MRSRRTANRCVLACASALTLAALAAQPAAAGDFSVANCQADPLGFSTRAFNDFATRGMKIRRACNPQGPGLRGFILGNVVRGGRVERGSVALATITAPPGTRFTTYRWEGTARRRDCRYGIQLWADGADIDTISLINVRPNRRCPKLGRAQAAYIPKTFDVPGATRIVQRVICSGGNGRRTCAANGANYLQTIHAEIGITDVVAPNVAILGDTPLARGEWVSGTQPLNYDANDNIGVRTGDAIVSGVPGGSHERPCSFATPERTYADQIPCPNGPGQISVDTTSLREGAQSLVVNAQDPAGNIGVSPAVTARVDNTPPGRVPVTVEGGEQWRNRNDFAVAWANQLEPDRAPIAAAAYKLCGLGGCARAEQIGQDLSRIDLAVPASGEWTVSLWRRDSAGNSTEAAASAPVALRYDAEPPQLGFETPTAGDPTLVAVQVTDKVSGLAGGVIELSASGSGTWQALPTRTEGTRLLSRIDDAILPAGSYILRARATDHARNESSTEHRLDGQPMAISLPLRIVSSMHAAFETTRKRGRRRDTTLTPVGRVKAGEQAEVSGRLTNRDGHGIPGAEIHVFSSSVISPEQLVAVLHTDGDGQFRYTAMAGTSRRLRFSHPGTPLVLPAEAVVTLRVRALTSLGVSRRRVLNGQAVTFSGRLRTVPIPAEGKLVELQARLSDRWQTFRTIRTDQAGRWSVPYRFRRTRGVQQYHFRAKLPPEAGYPFQAGGSRRLTVRVRGV
jgi:hypothetical protein